MKESAKFINSVFSRKNRLSIKLIKIVILCSSLFAILATCIQLYFKYSEGMSKLTKDLKYLEDNYVSSLSLSLYNIDFSQVKINLREITNIEGVVYAEVIETERLFGKHGEKIWVESKLGNGSKFVFSIPFKEDEVKASN